MGLLRDVELARPNRKPFAILKAANRQILKAIGRGIFRIKHIAVVAYVFKDDDLVHNLLGIAPFADCGCKAGFTAADLNLYHNHDLLLTGKRHSAYLWHIAHTKSLRTIIHLFRPHIKSLNALSSFTKTPVQMQSIMFNLFTPASEALHPQPSYVQLKEDTSRKKTNFQN